MSLLPAFPRRPLKLLRVPSRRIGLGQALGLLLFVGAAIFDAMFVLPSIYDDAMLGRSGTPAPEAHLGQGGKCKSKVFITLCDFEVIYRTADGTSRQASLHYLSVFQSIADGTRLSVRYDPANPDRVSTSWGRDLLVNRIAINAALLAFVVLLVGLFALSYRASLRTRKSLMAMAREPRAVVAELIGAMPRKKSAAIRFAWRDPATGTTRQDTSRLPGTTQPFWLDRERTTMLALAGPDGHAHLLDEELTLVELTDEERQRIRAAYRSGSAAA